MKDERRVPKRRFREFLNDGDWEKRKFKNIVEIDRGGSPRPIEEYITNSKNGLNWIKIGDAPKYGNYITKTKEKIIPKGLGKTREVHPGDLILSNSMSFGKPYIMKINGCIHDGWLLIRNVNEIFDLKYLCSMLGTEQMLLQYRAMAAGSTVNNLNKELVGNTIVNYPSKSEQAKIGRYIYNLDNIVILNQRKLEKLKALKKAYLTQMFPTDGECKPKLRFAGFNEEWKKCSIGELGSIITGSTPPTVDETNYGQDYLFVSPVDINNNRYIEDTVTKLSKKGFNLGRSVKAGSTLFVSIGSTIGKVGQVKQDVITNQQINAITYNENFDSNFIYCLTVNKARGIRKLAATQAVPIINKTTFSQVEVLVSTNIEEQQKIGDFFVKIDVAIESHQRKIEKLQSIKKAYLNEMFI